MYAEPFRLDYKQWAVEFAKLSVREPNLVAWSIDDFTHNLKVYTPLYVQEMLAASRRINPKPVSYTHPRSIDPFTVTGMSNWMWPSPVWA